MPATHLRQGEAFWSRSYMDPYSYQPMVTVTVTMHRDGAFYGVSTVDLKLEGLHEFLAQATATFHGYAFAVDRNGKFLSFPDEGRTKRIGTDAQGHVTQEFIDIATLARDEPSFATLAAAVQAHIDGAVSEAIAHGSYDAALAEAMARDSYQIGPREASLIAALLATRETRGRAGRGPEQILIDLDPLLGEPAFAAVFDMPDTAWKVVTVMPYSEATGPVSAIYRSLVTAIVAVMLVSLAIVMLFVRQILVRPIKDVSDQLASFSEDR